MYLYVLFTFCYLVVKEPVKTHMKRKIYFVVGRTSELCRRLRDFVCTLLGFPTRTAETLNVQSCERKKKHKSFIALCRARSWTQ